DDARDVLLIAERFADQTEERHLAAQAAQAICLEAELEDAALARVAMRGHPRLAEAALAKLLVEMPVRPARNFLTRRGTPAERQLVARRNRAPRLVGIGRHGQRRETDDADFID